MHVLSLSSRDERRKERRERKRKKEEGWTIWRERDKEGNEMRTDSVASVRFWSSAVYLLRINRRQKHLQRLSVRSFSFCHSSSFFSPHESTFIIQRGCCTCNEEKGECAWNEAKKGNWRGKNRGQSGHETMHKLQRIRQRRGKRDFPELRPRSRRNIN